MKRFGFLFVLVLICVGFVSAFTYDVTGINYLTSDGYEGGDGEFEATITASSENICTIVCTWETDSYGPESIGSPAYLSKGASKSFHFNVLLDGNNGQGSDVLVITCERYSDCLWGSDDTNFRQEIPFVFNWNGDEKCQYGNKILPEDCVNAEIDCICSSKTKCKEDLTRMQDLMGCTTYCGNGEIEQEYETCSNCQKDVGKCDGLSCLEGSECEGTYCVHNVCASSSYLEKDNNCDFNVGENCQNSPADCGCGNYERCSSGVCETWCGNGQCEASEDGICKADCDWCGDGECGNNENCNSCENDCGVCENKESNSEIIESAKDAVEEKINEAKTSQNYVIFSGAGLVVLVVAGYLSVKLVKLKKTNSKKSKKKNGKKTEKKKAGAKRK